MFFDEIVHGTQYYRAPTPLPSEWEEDIKNMGDYNLDAFQIRLSWRWYERKENEYDFSSIDKLFEIAEKNGRKVIIKFMLECAPQYIFDKYDGTRIGPRGEQIRGGSHGAFYGGWRPCFTNPMVQERAKLFVEKIAERYANKPNLILWNVWNEIRNKPFAECFCPHCRKAFGKYLQDKFGTVEKLNEFYGTAEESFDNIALPSTPHGYWDTYEFKKFKGSKELYNYVDFAVKAVKKYDKLHPVMTHVGFTSAFQVSIEDVCDDFTVSKAADFWGTSVPCDCSMQTNEQRLDFMMLNDFIRSVDKNYFIHEMYPGLGMFKWYDTPFDMNFKLYSALSSGVKGIIYWQYRAERIGFENDCSGIVNMDGSPKDVTFEIKKFGENLKRDMQYFVGGEAQKSDVAIVFDFNSMLLSEIEDVCGPDFEFNFCNPQFYYKNAHTGMYRLLRNSNYNVDYLGVTEPQKFKDYKVLYFPYYTILEKNVAKYIEEFVKNGGTVIADEGFGMRQENTWMQPYNIACEPVMKARLKTRRLVYNEYVELNGEKVKIRPYKTQYTVENGETLLNFEDGSPAIQKVKYGKGNIILCGFSLGYSYLEKNSVALEKFVENVLSESGIEKYTYSDVANGIYERRLENGDKEIIFIFNNSQETKEFNVNNEILACGGFGKIDSGKLVVEARNMCYIVVNRIKNA